MKTSDVGKLNRHIDLLRPVMQGKWKIAASVWAAIHRPGIRSGAMIGSAAAVIITQGVTIRQRSDIKKGWRIRYNGEIYDVIHIDSSVSGVLTLTCKDIEVKT